MVQPISQVENTAVEGNANTELTDSQVLTDIQKQAPEIKLGIGLALLKDAKYGVGPGQLQEVFNTWKTNKTLALDMLRSSKWGQLNSTARSNYIDKLEQSDVYQDELRSWKEGIRKQLVSEGLADISDADLENYFLTGKADDLIISDARKGITAAGAKGAVGDRLTQLRNVAKDNGLDLEKDFPGQVDGWLQSISSGTPIGDIAKQIRNAAATGITSTYVKNRLAAGENLTDIYAPYLNAMATKFGLANVDEIDLKDPLLANVFSDKGGMNVTKFNELLNADPRAKAAIGQAALGNVKQYIINYAIKQGYKLDDAAIQRIIDKATTMGITVGDYQFDPLINQEFAYKPGQQVGGLAGNALQTLTGTAAANGLDLQKDFGANLNDWLNRIAAGEQVSTFQNLIRQTAKTGLPPEMQKLLDQGLDLESVLSPYKSAMASTLELPSTSIQLSDILNKAVKDNAFASIYDFKRALRKDPRWQYTDNARADVSNSVLGVLRDFGFQG